VRIRNTRTLRFIRVGSIVVCAVGLPILILCVYVYYREKPSVQLVGQSTAHLSIVIGFFIDQNGKMPSSMDDFVMAGLIKRIKPCSLPGLNDDRATTEYRLNLQHNDHILYYLDDVVINWGVKPEDLRIRDGILVNCFDGEPDFIMGRRGLFDSDRVVHDINSSRWLYEALSNARQNENSADR